MLHIIGTTILATVTVVVTLGVFGFFGLLYAAAKCESARFEIKYPRDRA